MKDCTLDDLLSLSKKEREINIKKFTSAERQAIYNNIPTLTELLKLSKLKCHKKMAKKCEEWINLHPDKEWWDYGRYLNDDGELIIMDNKISTLGNTVILNSLNRLYVRSNNDFINNNVYMNLTHKNKPYAFHRTVAFTFKTPSNHLKHLPFNLLVANHKNKIKSDNRSCNIEWANESGNTRHSLGYENYDHSEYFLCEMVFDNQFEGLKFVINRYCSTIPKKMLTSLIKRAGSGELYFGIKVKIIKKEDIGNLPQEFPEILLTAIINYPEWFNPRVRPIIGTPVAGQYKGEDFGFLGLKYLNPYFSNANIMAALDNKKYYSQGLIWRDAPRREAIECANKMTDEICADIKLYTESVGPYKGVILEGPHAGYVFYIYLPKDYNGMFTLESISQVINKYQTSHRKCGFERITLEELPKNYPCVTKKMIQCTMDSIGPFKGVVKGGVYKGYHFYIARKNDYEGMFNITTIIEILRKEDSIHIGCEFTKISFDEIPDNYPVMTDDIFQTLIKYSKRIGPYKVTVKRGPFAGFVGYISRTEDHIDIFDVQTVGRICYGILPQSKNFDFKRIELSELPEEYPIISQEIINSL